MREIKFRAWLKNRIELCKVLSIHFDKTTIVISVQDGVGKTWFELGNENAELMQYTGLKDCQGVEIYEGDILRWYGYEVKGGKQIRPEKLLVVADYIRDAHKVLCITEGTGQMVEVIGNIYENPELLEV